MINLLIQKSPLSEEERELVKSWGYEIKDFQKKIEAYFEWPEVIVASGSAGINEFEKFSNLKFVQLYSAGFDSLDLELAKQFDIKISNARGVYSVQIAEYVLAKILMVYKETRLYEHLQQTKEWTQTHSMISMVNQKVAILGTGSIGQEIAKRLQPFEVEITGFNTVGRLDPYFDYAYALTNLEENIQKYDIVIISLPLNKATHHLFNKELLLKLKEDATLVNIGRGPIINQEDLVSVLDAHLRAVILDVFEVEPLPKENPLWNHPKAYLTPHISFYDDSTKSLRVKSILDNLERYAKKEVLKNRVV